MSYGMLRVPADKSNPLVLFYKDLEKIKEAIDKGSRVFPSSFFDNGLLYLGDGEIREEDGNLKVSPIERGLFHRGLFAISEEMEIDLPSADGEYVVYAVIEEGDESVSFPDDPYTPLHNYDKETISILLSPDENIDHGVRLGKISVVGNSGSILDTERKRAYIKDEFMPSITPRLDSDRFFVNDEGRISINVPDSTDDFLSIVDEHKESPVLDHPDLSVTTEKLGDGAVTKHKILLDVTGEPSEECLTGNDIYASRNQTEQPYRSIAAELLSLENRINAAENKINSVTDICFVASGLGGTVATSVDGHSWIPRYAPYSAGYGGIVFGQDHWVIGAEGGVVISSDGLTWTNYPLTISPRNMLFADGRWFCNKNSLNRYGAITTSNLPIGFSSSSPSADLSMVIDDIHYGGSRGWMAVGSGAFSTSADGITWSKKDLPLHPRTSSSRLSSNSVAYGGGKWVAVCDAGYILYSMTAIAFTISSYKAPVYLHGVAYGGGKWVAVGASGFIATSGDGVSWAPVNLSLASPTPTLFSAVYVQDRWFVCGSHNTILSSSNGTDWSPVTFLSNTLPPHSFGLSGFLRIASSL